MDQNIIYWLPFRIFVSLTNLPIMILYNVTINVEQSVEQEWLRWMQTEHVLDVLNTKMFVTARIFRLLEVEQSEGTSTYAVQYFAKNREDYERYQQAFAPPVAAGKPAKIRHQNG